MAGKRRRISATRFLDLAAIRDDDDDEEDEEEGEGGEGADLSHVCEGGGA